MASNMVSFDYAFRILLVDSDSLSLMNLQMMLNQININHQVWTCSSAGEAVKMLGKQNEIYKFEIVMSDVNMSDMDACKFFDLVANKLDIPLIMMSMNGETSKVEKGIQHGACVYLPKPIIYKDVRYIWQYVYCKTLLQNKHQIAVDHENSPVITETVPMAGKNKREREIFEISNRGGGGGENADDFSRCVKKTRVIWTTELNIKFMNAVAQINKDKEKVGPKRILELMNEPSLTRENISSHLQKYRIKIGKDTGSQVCDTNNICSQQSINTSINENCGSIEDQIHNDQADMDLELLDGNNDAIDDTFLGSIDFN